MTEHPKAVPPRCEAAPCLYSQTSYDDRGNFHYTGDYYRQAEPFDELAARIERHICATFPNMRFSVRTERFAGGRKVKVEILDAPDDLTDRDAQNNMIVTVRDQVERFGFTRSNPLQDFFSCSFYSDVALGRAYWSALARRRGQSSPVEATLSLAAFRKRLKAGDRMTLISAPGGHRALGTTRTVTAVRSKDFVFDGRSYMEFPRAANFACDGRLVRIAIGNEYEPDAHLLYEWLPQQIAA
ncbi:hypothetical protein M2337_002401 [Sphingobium sp. B2D3A]|uniref:hypothetical protein n=1 Tax=unclassified Sphingobium TaxID=2611147 RepID=UPI00222553AA|nr:MULTISPECIES: hypothetical protein [unclassified Sphingobium]MCW2338168.1 hypothetical protein [Sphingobium sp. B2D3A]MCW2384627.1 hypothetical protein [Sphingobium sp. B2D3D]